MSDLDKINIHVPFETLQTIEKDAMLFEILKSDGCTINKNKFLSRILLGYGDTYAKECKQKRDEILRELDTFGFNYHDKNQLANKILKETVLPEIGDRDGSRPNVLHLKPTNETEGFLLAIQDELEEDDYLSRYLCRMLISYCRKPIFERERIIFQKQYGFLLEACKTHSPISFVTKRNKKRRYRVIPFALAVGTDEAYNYLLCQNYDVEKGLKTAGTYRLGRIEELRYDLKGVKEFDVNVERHLEQMMKYGPQYAINEDVETCVRMTKEGIFKFNRIYYGRPMIDRIEASGDEVLYYFTCSINQLSMYFKRFSDGSAVVVYPEELRREIEDFHLQAYLAYKECN